MTSSEQLDFMHQLLQIMKDNQLSSLTCGDIVLTASDKTHAAQPTPKPAMTKSPELTPEQILGLDQEEMVNLALWSSGGDPQQVINKLNKKRS